MRDRGHPATEGLPAFVARNLWRLWRTVESAVVTPERVAWILVPVRTLRRWRERVMLAARVVLHVLSSLRTPALDELVAAIGLDATRWALLVAFRPLAGRLGALAALTVLLGKVLPGLRVM